MRLPLNGATLGWPNRSNPRKLHVALADYLFTGYDIPSELRATPVSPELEKFVGDVFVYAGRDGITTPRLSPDELALARLTVRRNLSLNFVHVISAAGVLRDHEAVPQLSSMLARESDESRRLSIAGSLWQIERHPAFPECLRVMVDGDNAILKQAHIDQVMWLQDERVVDLLTELLEDDDTFVQHLALSKLNRIEHKKDFLCRSNELPSQSPHYLTARHDPQFRTMMVRHLCEETARELAAHTQATLPAKRWRIVDLLKGLLLRG